MNSSNENRLKTFTHPTLQEIIYISLFTGGSQQCSYNVSIFTFLFTISISIYNNYIWVITFLSPPLKVAKLCPDLISLPPSIISLPQDPVTAMSYVTDGKMT